MGLEIRGDGGGGQKAYEFLKEGGGIAAMNFFFQTGLNFHAVVRKVSLFAFCFSSHKCKNNKSW